MSKEQTAKILADIKEQLDDIERALNGFDFSRVSAKACGLAARAADLAAYSLVAFYQEEPR